MKARQEARPSAAERSRIWSGEMLPHLGEDPSREGLQRTPERVAKGAAISHQRLHGRYPQDRQRRAVSRVKYDEMVIVKDIEFFSLCEHHLLPFFGKMHVAYLPKDKVIGLSKIPRIVDMFARRLQIQERLTQQIAADDSGSDRAARASA